MTQSDTEAKPWTEEEIATARRQALRTSIGWPESYRDRWLATLKLRDEEIARLRARLSDPSLQELRARAYGGEIATATVDELRAELASARALLATADRAVASFESLREESRTLKAQVRSADEASIAATKARERAENQLRLSLINERSTEGERDLAQAEVVRLRSELEELAKSALANQYSQKPWCQIHGHYLASPLPGCGCPQCAQGR